MLKFDQIRIDSDKICAIFNEYALIHTEAEKIKKEIKSLEDRLSEFAEKALKVREKENAFYKEIAEKFNIEVEEVKRFVANAALRIKAKNGPIEN